MAGIGLDLARAKALGRGRVFGTFSALLLGCALLVPARAAPPPAAEQAWREADSRLQAVFRQMLRHVSDPRSREDLQKAQKAWQTFRDAEAAARAGLTSQGGSAYGADQLHVLHELTEERLRQMRETLKIARGDPRQPTSR